MSNKKMSKSHERLRHCAFSHEEDANLRKGVEQFGEDWKKVAENMTRRSARQCRERWYVLYKRRESQRPWTNEEDQLLVQKCLEMGPRWNLIEGFFIDRNSLSLKNRWQKLTREAEIDSLMMSQNNPQPPQIEEKHEIQSQQQSTNKQIDGEDMNSTNDFDFWNFFQFNDNEMSELYPMENDQLFGSFSGPNYDIW